MAVEAKNLSQALADVEFVVNQCGESKGVFVPVIVWEALLSALEDVEGLAGDREFLSQRAAARSPKEMRFERGKVSRTSRTSVRTSSRP